MLTWEEYAKELEENKRLANPAEIPPDVLEYFRIFMATNS
jgi:hypothetical protein